VDGRVRPSLLRQRAHARARESETERERQRERQREQQAYNTYIHTHTHTHTHTKLGLVVLGILIRDFLEGLAAVSEVARVDADLVECFSYLSVMSVTCQLPGLTRILSNASATCSAALGFRV